ncbi:MAG: YncE family protein [Planctomycetota bacterium]
MSIFAAPGAAQTFHQEIDLFGLGDPLSAAKPFGITYEPVTDRIFVGLAGDFASNNNAVVIIDPNTDTVIGSIPVGLFPEDIAFSYGSLGGLEYGAVTNSTSGSVSIWDANDRVVSTIVLPDPFGFGTCYPFGIVAHQGKFFVSTQDGSGDVHAIDIATLSYDPGASFHIGPRSGSRMAAYGDSLRVATTAYLPAFDGSKGGLFLHDTTGTVPDESWFAERKDQFLGFPSGQDVALLADGSGYLTGLDFSGHLYRIDAAGALDRAIDLEGLDGHGLALDPAQELLAVASLTGNELLLVDVLNQELLSRTSVTGLGSGYMQPNEVVFAHDKLYLTVQANEAVLVFDDLPSVTFSNPFRGSLTLSDSTPFQGTTVAMDLDGFPGQTVALVRSSGTLPTLQSGIGFLIGTDLALAGSSSTGHLHVDLTIPMTPSLEGVQFFLQGYISDGVSDFTTEPKVLVIQ